MFGPCPVELEGRRYFANVAVRECHTFEYEGNVYLLDVQGLAAHAITPGLAALIGRLGADPSLLLPEAVLEKLRGLGIVVGEGDEAARSQAGPSTGAAEFPVVSISLFVAQACNMRCVYCYGNGGEYAGGGMMDESTALRAIDWLMENSRSARQVNVGFFGGEPLLNFPVIRKVVPYARRKAREAGKAIAFSMTTNGSLFTEEVIAFIREENIKLLISFDGPPEVQNRQRPFWNGTGSYDLVAANIGRLRETVPHLSARATVYGDTDPLAIQEALARVGFSAYVFAPASPVLLGHHHAAAPVDGANERRLDRMRAFHRQEADELLAAIRGRAIVKDAPLRALLDMGDLLTGKKRHHACGIGKNLAAISVTGDIYPCHRFVGLTELRQGNIADYTSGAPNAYHRAVVDSLPVCRRCWARYVCGGGCFYLNKATTGDMHRPTPLDCQERRSMFEGLVHVYCQLDAADREYARGIVPH
ncbi:MAG: radical SAM protein [Solidesulfovibrio sp. DCME]|uniref:radical SAM protein n=1 Tax=Solidesulfovibrio sp. DCME TaxID=3447380 RepID=UPI003D0DF8C3